MSDKNADLESWMRECLGEPEPIPTLDLEQVDAEGNVVRVYRLTNVTISSRIRYEDDSDCIETVELKTEPMRIESKEPE